MGWMHSLSSKIRNNKSRNTESDLRKTSLAKPFSRKVLKTSKHDAQLYQILICTQNMMLDEKNMNVFLLPKGESLSSIDGHNLSCQIMVITKQVAKWATFAHLGASKIVIWKAQGVPQ